MQLTQSGSILFSPSDLVAFLGCRHSSLLTRSFLGKERAPAEEDSNLALLQQKGFEHERAYLEHLKQQKLQVVEIPKDRGLKEKAELSLDAMRQGADVIYQAVFSMFPWRGDADFLIKRAAPSAFGKYSYEVLDTKLARAAEPKHILQLCAYSEYLARLQEIRPKNMHLVLGDGKQHSFDVDDFFFYYLNVKQRFEAFQQEPGIAADPATTPVPSPCAHCDFCNWSALCAERREREDHLSLVANIQRGQIDKFNRAGIGTLAQLAALPPDFRVPEMQRETFARLRSQAALQMEKRTTGQGRVELLPQEPGKGFARLPRPDKGDLFFDMEGDPYYPDRLEYLFGVYFEQGGKGRFLPFWGHDHEEEKQAFCGFMAFVGEHLATHPDACIYHYNHYETTALKRLACRYAVCEEQLDNLLRYGKFVDLYVVVREALRTSEPGYSIKNLEAFYMDKRANAVANAAESIVVYNRWRELRDPALLQEIADYNEVDCVSTCLLRNWLLQYRPEQLPWRGEADEEPTATFTEHERKPWEIEYEGYRAKLSEACPPEVEDEVLPLLAHLLEFHRREDKPQWWNSFARQEKADEDLLDDLDCIAGLRLQGTPVQNKRSLVYAYRFPEQEYRIRVKDQVVDVGRMKTAGTVSALDERSRTIHIRRGMTQEPLPECLNIGPRGPIDADEIRSSIYRFADRVLDGSSALCGLEILRRAKPRIMGKKPGAPILGGRDALAETIEAVAGLDHSYLFIQGPPGSGKTYVSSHVIVELMRRGRCVGVSSNSHKAIHNLLEQVEKVAREKGFDFTGIKKATTGKDETFFDGVCIRNVERAGDIPRGCNLYAGTAWMFAHEHCENLVDVLCIDEAGQVALANVLAMSCAAENIVLVGDQMQLGQPTQGTHPGESGASVLEYLLGDQAAIAPDQGIFLAETRRMAPAVCSFISDAFYDGQLSAHPDTAKRHLNICLRDPVSGAALPNAGIVLVEAHHRHCAQKSQEEAALVKTLYGELLAGSFRDKDGRERTLTPDDILVVSPYNMQVNLLEDTLPAGARVGTVDKFQGQEAPVVFFSMATSSAQDLPRNIEFLFSKNRLNVALSRAQCLAVVVASPLLAEVPCNTIDQMRLVNTFCRLCV